MFIPVALNFTTGIYWAVLMFFPCQHNEHTTRLLCSCKTIWDWNTILACSCQVYDKSATCWAFFAPCSGRIRCISGVQSSARCPSLKFIFLQFRFYMGFQLTVISEMGPQYWAREVAQRTGEDCSVLGTVATIYTLSTLMTNALMGACCTLFVRDCSDMHVSAPELSFLSLNDCSHGGPYAWRLLMKS